MALGSSMRPCGDFRTTYASDMTIFATPVTRYIAIAFIVALFFVPLTENPYILNLMIQIGYYGIAALGLNLVVGFTGQIEFDPGKPDGTPRKLLDVTRLNQLGWKATTSLSDGLMVTYKSYLSAAGEREPDGALAK